MKLERLFDIHPSTGDRIGCLKRGDEALEQCVGIRAEKLWPIVMKHWIDSLQSLLGRGGGLSRLVLERG
jgi:hypothetical protein